MNALSFPDVNVWSALILDHYVRRSYALQLEAASVSCSVGLGANGVPAGSQCD